MWLSNLLCLMYFFFIVQEFKLLIYGSTDVRLQCNKLDSQIILQYIIL